MNVQVLRQIEITYFKPPLKKYYGKFYRLIKINALKVSYNTHTYNISNNLRIHVHVYNWRGWGVHYRRCTVLYLIYPWWLPGRRCCTCQWQHNEIAAKRCSIKSRQWNSSNPKIEVFGKILINRNTFYWFRYHYRLSVKGISGNIVQIIRNIRVSII